MNIAALKVAESKEGVFNQGAAYRLAALDFSREKHPFAGGKCALGKILR